MPSRPERTGRRTRALVDELDAFSIQQFCARHGISTQLYYKQRERGLMPREIHIGSRVLITREAAARWRAALEVAAS
jgi:hypothetical protein